ncbi:hypothetical protein EW093_16230 [Thiospirochaeta perfilievii]|uniref:Uncharacterized protein n=1 Tax=Thiospirochaeta perfilievii TaxID=252967 RepID=A0A5C1QGG7_9SPIO|nr:hypothetical protein [Thiospirochaeta perfilievii]QEN06169.1 hypothetical protein EW093_16230 [Thiospirochaeta perfilievii]
MSTEEERQIISDLLKLYPDVVNNLGGEKVVNTDSILERIANYIEKHKWLVNEKIPYTITLEQAFFSWYENVFFPQWTEMVNSNILTILNKYTPYELYKMVSTEYFYLMESDRSTYYNKACYAVILRESKSFFTRLSAKIKLSRL